MVNGLTLGKFMLHKGHELLLEIASEYCDNLVILLSVTDHDQYSYSMRKKWIEDFLYSIKATNYIIEADIDPDSNVQKDEFGTITDETYWDQWLAQNADVLSNTDVVFTSDRYGAEIAKRANLKWFPVDPDREVFQISSTQIRADSSAYPMLSDFAKQDVGYTIAVVGAESTGKSTLVKNLAKNNGFAYAPEWGRIICEARPNGFLTYSDFSDIVYMQQKLIAKARSQTKVSITDTEMTTTAMFANIYLGESHTGAELAAATQDIDAYIVLAPTVPLVNDGTRILDEQDRLDFHEELLTRIEAYNKPMCIIDAVDFDDRLDHAQHFIENWSKTK